MTVKMQKYKGENERTPPPLHTHKQIHKEMGGQEPLTKAMQV